MDVAHFAWSLFHANNFNSCIIMFHIVGHFSVDFSVHLDLLFLVTVMCSCTHQKLDRFELPQPMLFELSFHLIFVIN